ncbi:hypothetical protein KKG71_02640 [Patescibacteria group bacterium]|nr:hypothetical protein [Patescibacteria group bacterium]
MTSEEQKAESEAEKDTPENPEYLVDIVDISPYTEKENGGKIDFPSHIANYLLRPLIGLGLLNRHHKNPGDFQFSWKINEKGNPVFKLGDKNPLSFEAQNNPQNGETDWSSIWQEFQDFLIHTLKEEFSEIIEQTTEHLQKQGFECKLIEYRMKNSFADNRNGQVIESIIPEVKIIATNPKNNLTIIHYPKSNLTTLERNDDNKTFEAFNSNKDQIWVALIEGWEKIISTAENNVKNIQKKLDEERKIIEGKIKTLLSRIKKNQERKEFLAETGTSDLSEILSSLKNGNNHSENN